MLLEDKMEKQIKEMEQRGRKTNNDNLLKAALLSQFSSEQSGCKDSNRSLG